MNIKTFLLFFLVLLSLFFILGCQAEKKEINELNIFLKEKVNQFYEKCTPLKQPLISFEGCFQSYIQLDNWCRKKHAMLDNELKISRYANHQSFRDLEFIIQQLDTINFFLLENK